MKKYILFLISIIIGHNASAQLVARVQLKDSVPGICDMSNIYALFPSFGDQVEAVCPLSKTELIEKLNSELTFLKDNPKFKGKCMMGLLINCDGKVVQCKMDNASGNAILDAQIEAIFNTLLDWKAGKLNGEYVDSSRLFSFKIKKGVIAFEY